MKGGGKDDDEMKGVGGGLFHPVKSFFRIFLFLLVILIGYMGYEFYTFLKRPLLPEDGETIIVNIPLHSTTREVVGILYRNGVIMNRELFLLYIKLKGGERSIKAGEFGLKASMTPEEVFDILYEGKEYLHRLMIPEGFNLLEIAALLKEKGFGKEEDFFEFAFSKEVLAGYGVKGDSLEGFLFPDTYYLPRSYGMEGAVKMMVENFFERFTPSMRGRAREIGMSIYEVVTLASLIEKETGAPFERRRISGVFHNRLERGMKLQCDPTIIYSLLLLSRFDGNIRKGDKFIDSPYNTYVVDGLPKGPICSPGLASLNAALSYEKHEYLYFVSKNDGTHHFSKTLKEHNEAVRVYQMGGGLGSLSPTDS